MWELAKFLWKWIFVIFVCLLIIAIDGWNFFVEMVLFTIGSMVALIGGYYCFVKYKIHQRVKVLGCREHKNHKSSEEQFRNQCRMYSISAYSRYQIMVCDYLREIESKGLHIELVKEDGIVYSPYKKGYLGSKDWQDKWSRIVFSPKITGWKFCRSIGVILRAHGISGIFDLDIRRSDSYETYGYLNLLRYNILIKENDDSLKDCEVTTPRTLRRRLRNRAKA